MTTAEKQTLREAVLTVLADRPGRALSVTETTRRIRAAGMTDSAFAEEDTREALAVLQGLGLVDPETAPLGAGQTWRATAQGVLFRERNLP